MTILIQNDHPDPDNTVYAHTDTCPEIQGFVGWTYDDNGVGVERAIQNFLGDHPEMCAEATDVVVHNCPSAQRPDTGRTEYIMLLNDGETFTDLSGCMIVRVTTPEGQIEEIEDALDREGSGHDQPEGFKVECVRQFGILPAASDTSISIEITRDQAELVRACLELGIVDWAGHVETDQDAEDVAFVETVHDALVRGWTIAVESS